MWFRARRLAKAEEKQTREWTIQNYKDTFIDQPVVPYFSIDSVEPGEKVFEDGWKGEEWAWLTGPKGGGTTLYYLKQAIDKAIAKGAPLNTPVEQIDAKVTESGHRDAINLFVKTGKEFNTKAHNEALLKANRKQIKKARAQRKAYFKKYKADKPDTTKGLVPGQGVASKTPPAPANATNS